MRIRLRSLRATAGLVAVASCWQCGSASGGEAPAGHRDGGGDASSSTGGIGAGSSGSRGSAGGGGTKESGGSDAGGSGRSGDASPPDAGGSGGSGDASPPDAGASDADAPRPTPPCGTDLDVHNGTAHPDYGTLPSATTTYTGTDPSSDGPLTVTAVSTSVPIAAGTLTQDGQSITVTAGSLTATAYVPEGSGPFPLVIVLPGFTQSHTAYATFSQHFASHGFATLGVDTRGGTTLAVHDQEAYEVVQTIDWVLSGKSPLGTTIDATKIAVAGHSKGGKVAFYAAALDPRIDLVIGWDPSNSGGGPCAFDPNCNRLPVAPNCNVQSPGLESSLRAETLVVGAPPDPLWNPDEVANSKHFYRGAPSPAALVVLNTGHASWASLTANADVVRITKYVHIARLLERFRNEAGLDTYLPGGAVLNKEPLLLDVRVK